MEDERRYNQNNRQRGGRGQRGHRHSGGRPGRSQRPLLTSSTNAAGLSLIALGLSVSAMNSALSLFSGALSIAVIAFVVSALISYFAQRSPKKWIEKISDVFFFVGMLVIVYVAGGLGGFWASTGM